MPTITIDLPDDLNVPSNWDARMFFVAKMYEAGFLSSDQAAQTVGVSPPTFFDSARGHLPEPANPEPESQEPESQDTESWFTPEQIAQFKENRRRLERELDNPQTKKNQEELYQLLLNGPVADEETIRRQDEIREEMMRWTLPW
jgi:hypothetical protein